MCGVQKLHSALYQCWQCLRQLTGLLECTYSSSSYAQTPENNKASAKSDCTPTHVRANSAENSLWNWQMAVIDSETDTKTGRHQETVSLHPAFHRLALCHAN